MAGSISHPTLLVVRPDGTTAEVPNSYEGIKQGLDGGTIDFVAATEELGVYLDDDGISKRLALNVPISCLTGRLIYGSCVVCHGVPNDNGDTLPPTERPRRAALGMATLWRAVWREAQRNGQDIRVYADPDTQRPAQVIGLTNDEFDHYLATGEWPHTKGTP
jgi:hypothetical protein